MGQKGASLSFDENFSSLKGKYFPSLPQKSLSSEAVSSLHAATF